MMLACLNIQPIGVTHYCAGNKFTLRRFVGKNNLKKHRSVGETLCASSDKASVSVSDENSLLTSQNLTRNQGLKDLDDFLEAGNDEKALETVRKLRHLPKEGLRAFGTAFQIPKRLYNLDELRLNKIDTSKFLSPADTTIGRIKQAGQAALLLGLVAVWKLFELDQPTMLAIIVSLLFIGTMDQVLNSGGGESLLLDSLANSVSPQYRKRVAQHEAGHFLISYLLGILPRSYTLNSLDVFRKYGALNVQAGTTFVDAEFMQEMSSGKMTSETLDKFTCIALAGVATEYLRFGVAEGGLSDIIQLDRLMKSLGFTQKKADSQVRWAVLNTITLLRRHTGAHDKLTEAMMASLSVGECIQVIEDALRDCRDLNVSG